MDFWRIILLPSSGLNSKQSKQLAVSICCLMILFLFVSREGTDINIKKRIDENNMLIW
jgi:hypothetical protein